MSGRPRPELHSILQLQAFSFHSSLITHHSVSLSTVCRLLFLRRMKPSFSSILISDCSFGLRAKIFLNHPSPQAERGERERAATPLTPPLTPPRLRGGEKPT